VYVRTFQVTDFPKLIKLAETMASESPYFKGSEIDKIKVTRLGYEIITSGSAYCGFVALENARIIGFFIGYCIEAFFSSQRIASDLALYVPQDERGGRAAIALIRRFEAWAKERGAQKITLGISTGITVDRTEQLYNRLGFETTGRLCQKST